MEYIQVKVVSKFQVKQSVENCFLKLNSRTYLIFLFLHKTHQRLWIIFLIIIIWGGGHFLKKIEWTEPNGEPIEVTLLQGNVKQDEKWNQTKIKKILNKYESLILKVILH